MNSYDKLPDGPKRLIWAGYVAYLAFVFLLDGLTPLVDAIRHMLSYDLLVIVAMLLLYWVLIFIALWVKDGFDP